MVRIVNNIAGTAICFFVPAKHFFVCTFYFHFIHKSPISTIVFCIPIVFSFLDSYRCTHDHDFCVTAAQIKIHEKNS